jgi:hypothetical protein
LPPQLLLKAGRSPSQLLLKAAHILLPLVLLKAAHILLPLVLLKAARKPLALLLKAAKRLSKVSARSISGRSEITWQPIKR